MDVYTIYADHSEDTTAHEFVTLMRKFLDKMTVNSTLASWDKKYVYFETRFFVKNQLMGVGMTKFVLTNKKGKCAPEILDMIGERLNEVIDSWNQHQVAIKSTETSKTTNAA